MSGRDRIARRARIGAVGLLAALGSSAWRGGRAADPQPYDVTIQPTGDAAIDAGVTSSATLLSLRQSAAVGPFALLARARADLARFRAVLDSEGHYDGTVSVTLAGQSAATQIGQIQLANFINPPGLQPIGQNLLLQTAASGSPQTGSPGTNGVGTLSQGELESSNVNVVEELVNMIQTQRAYEMNSKAISTVDQMLQYATQNA